MNNQNIVIVVLVAIVFTGTGFFAGTKYQQSRNVSQRNQLFSQPGNRVGGNVAGANGMMGRNGGFRGGQILGDIISADSKSITVKLADGSSKIIILSETTSINQASAATVVDLKVGAKVATFGTTNSDGSVTAQNIQINPIIREFGPQNTSPTPSK